MNEKEFLDNDKSLLEAIYNKLSSIEERISRTENLLLEGKNVLSTSVDTFDSLLTKPEANKKVENIQLILKKISSDESIDRIVILFEKLEKILPIVENTNFIEFLVDILDDFHTTFKKSGVELSSLVENLLKILPALADKKTFELISKILENTDNINNMITMMDSLPGVINTAVDSFDEYATLINNKESLNNLKDNFQKIKEDLSISINKVNNKSENFGIFDILKLLNDPDVRKQIFVGLLAVKSVSNKILK